MTNQTQSNINALKLLYGDIITANIYSEAKDGSLIVDMTGYDNTVKFNIFAETPQGAWDRERVVIALMKQGVFIAPVYVPDGYAAFNNADHELTRVCKTYPEAIAAACNEVAVNLPKEGRS